MALAGTLLLACWIALVTLVFNLVVADRLHRQADDSLRARAQSAAATVVIDAAGAVRTTESAADTALDAGVWIYVDTRAVEKPIGLDGLSQKVDRLAGTDGAFVDATPDYRLYSMRIQAPAGAALTQPDQVVTVIAAIDTAPYTGAKTDLLLGSIALGGVAALAAYLVLRRTARRALQPVEVMTEQALTWSATDVEQRFDRGGRYAELDRLASTFNEVLDRISAAARHERRVSEDLSHELRTPLSRILGEAELLVADGPDDDRLVAGLRSIRDGAERIDRILTTVLDAARASTGQTTGRSKVCNAVDQVVVDHPPDSAETSVHVEIGDEYVGVDQAVVERIVAPILVNAYRFARHEIVITGYRSVDSVVIEITDDGPGIEEAIRDDVFRPGFRAGPGGGHKGAGLGLALSRRLARSCDGDVVVIDATTFRVRLPVG